MASNSEESKSKFLVDQVGEVELPEGIVHTPARGIDEPARVSRKVTSGTDAHAISEARQRHAAEVATLYEAALTAIDSGDYLFSEHLWALEAQKQTSINTLKAILTDENRTATTKAKAAHVLIQLAEVSGEDFLFDSLTSKDAETRLAALKMLGEWGIDIDFSKDDRPDLLTAMMFDADEAVRTEAVDLCVRKQLPGTEEQLVQLIEENGVADLGKAALDLGRIASEPNSVEVMLRHLLKEPEEEYSQWTGFALEEVLKNPQPEVSEPVRKALHAYTLSFKEDRYDQSLVRDLSMTADEESLDVLEDIYQNAKDIVSRLYALEAIARLQPKTAVERTLQHIRSDRPTGMAIDILAQHVSEEDASRVIPVVDPGSGSISQRVVRLMLEQLGETGTQHVVANRDRLDATAEMWVAWKLEGINLISALDELTKANVVSESAVTLLSRMNKARKEQGESEVDASDPSEFLAALGHTNRLVAFDAETGMLPCNHHRLLLDFAKASSGALQIEAPGEIWHQKSDDDYDAPYTVQFIHQGKLYRFGAENYGDWYDVEAVHNALNNVLEENGREERFIGLASDGQMASFVFAKPATFIPIAKKYRLPLSEDATEAMQKGKAFEQEVFEKIQNEE